MTASIDSISQINFKGSLYNAFFEKLPNKNIGNSVKYNKLGQKLASPHWNRLTLGVGAVTTQPLIDFSNPKVDRDTAKASAYRSGAKAVACTTVGFIVRGTCYKLTEKYAKASKEEGSTLLTPKAILNEINPELRKSKLKLHKNAFSTIFALSVMVFTNFLIDAPLTTLLSNYLISKDKTLSQNKKNDTQISEVFV